EPKGVSVLPTIIAARRRIVAARLTTLRVRELSTRCPLILLLGLSPSQETKAFSLRHLVMLVPISLIKVKIARTFNPGMVVRSTPRMRFRCPAKLVSIRIGNSQFGPSLVAFALMAVATSGLALGSSRVERWILFS